MGLKYNYDESGVFFYYFVASLLGLVLVPGTLLWLRSEARRQREQRVAIPEEATLDPRSRVLFAREVAEDAKKTEVRRRRIKQRRRGVSWTVVAALAGAWMLLAVLVAAIAATPDTEPALWSPWTILGVDSSASQSEIKRAYRRLSLKYHPDKQGGAGGAEAESAEAGDVAPASAANASEVEAPSDDRYIELSKAYKVLTDDEARARWEEHGSPDGRQAVSLGIALPAYIVESANAYKMLLLYGLMFWLVLPVVVSRWWGRSKKVTKDNVYGDTMALFFGDVSAEATPLKLVIEVLCAAREFSTLAPPLPALGDLPARVAAAAKDKNDAFAPTKRYAGVPWHEPTLVLLYAHFLRVPISDEALLTAQLDIVETAMRLLGALLHLAISRRWIRMTAHLVHLGRMLVQAVYYLDHPLYQLPNAPLDIGMHANVRKRTIPSVSRFLRMLPSDRRALFRTISDEEYEVTECVARHIPTVAITSVEFRVVGETLITPGCFITAVLQLRVGYPRVRSPAGEKTGAPASPTSPTSPTSPLSPTSPVVKAAPLTDAELEALEPSNGKAWWTSSKSDAPGARPTLAHAPFYPGEKRLALWVSLTFNNDQGLIDIKKVSDLVLPPLPASDDGSDAADELPFVERTLLFRFQGPDQPGTFPFKISVRCDAYLGLDIVQAAELVVVAPPPGFHDSDVDDDISEPDEDTISGQLALLRSGQLGSEQSLSKGKLPRAAEKRPVPKQAGGAAAADGDAGLDEDEILDVDSDDEVSSEGSDA